MSKSSPAVTGVSFSANFSFAQLTSTTDMETATISPIFTNVVNLAKVTGSYTPNNDNPIAINFDNYFEPKWLFLLCDAQLNILVSYHNGTPPTVFLTTSRLLLWTSVQAPANGYTYSTLQLDGRTGSTNYVYGSMTQGQPVNYTFYFGDGTVT